jgi:hypothetical protein
LAIGNGHAPGIEMGWTVTGAATALGGAGFFATGFLVAAGFFAATAFFFAAGFFAAGAFFFAAGRAFLRAADLRAGLANAFFFFAATFRPAGFFTAVFFFAGLRFFALAIPASC